MGTDPQQAARARALVRGELNGVLSTLSLEMEGWPFGSLAPYVLDYSATPHVLISRLAEHTRNIEHDPRVSLMVREHAAAHDALAVGRVTLLARAHAVEVGDVFRARFIRYLPEAEDYLALGDFRFYRLELARVRYIGGFGAIHWLAPDGFLLDEDAPELRVAEGEAVAHMNADHVDAMRRYCRATCGVECREPRMLGVDPEGFDLQTEHGRLRVPFPEPVRDPHTLRAVLVRMATRG